MAHYGIELLDQGNWTAERFAEAVAMDLGRLQSPEGKPDPGLESSLSRVMENLAQHVLILVLESRFEELGVFSREISAIFSRFPRLPLSRDLSLDQRMGVRLETILGQIIAVQSLPGRSKTEFLFEPGSKGLDSRVAVMQCLYEERDGLNTQEVMKRAGIEIRQTAHLVLRKLREHGLVVSDSVGPFQHHMLSPSGRRLWEKRLEKEESVGEPTSKVPRRKLLYSAS